MRQVGQRYDVIKDGETKKRKFTYPNVKTDPGGWADCQFFLPESFDLVLMKIGDIYKMGWFQGGSWDGYTYEAGEKVTHWKRVVE